MSMMKLPVKVVSSGRSCQGQFQIRRGLNVQLKLQQLLIMRAQDKLSSGQYHEIWPKVAPASGTN